MRRSEVSAAGLVAAAVIATLAFTLGPVHFGWTPTIVSVIVLAVLLAYDRAPARKFVESFAYGAVCGFLITTAIIFPLYQFAPQMAISPAEAFSSKPWLPAMWLAATVIFLGVDRVRQNTRPVVLEMSAPPIALVSVPLPAAIPVPSPPAPVVSAEPIRPAVPTPPAPEAPLRPVQVASQPAAAPNRVPARPAPAPAPQPVLAGRPATVYLNLVGTGIACLRAVKAEYLGKDFYRITEPVPNGEQWEFQTGQIVRCRKKTLSSGKAMVAFEEAPRAN